jgi:hypothetical protein
MSIPGFGDAMLIWDTTQRVIGFINDLRHAQDDLIGLRAEAKCLIVCLNALYSTECKAALHFISQKQGEDLKTIVESCKLNMVDLNKFVARCEKMAGDSYSAAGGGVSKKRSWWAKAWARLKFVWADKQPFRDKLALPTASINIFLTSLVHVSLSQVRLSSRRNIRSIVTGNELKGWKAIGQRVAFRDSAIVAVDLMQGNIEDEIVAYALHLIHGGTPPSRKPVPALGNGATNTPAGKSKAPQSRRKPIYHTTSDRMFLVRDKKAGRSRSRIRANSTEIVQPEPESRSSSEAEFNFFSPPPQQVHSPHSYETWEPEDKRRASDESNRYGARFDHSSRREEARRASERDYETEVEDESEYETRRQRSVKANVRRQMRREREEAIAEMQRQLLSGQHVSDQANVQGRMRGERQEAFAEMQQQVPSGQHVSSQDYMEKEYGVVIEFFPGYRPPIDAGTVGSPEELSSSSGAESDPEPEETIMAGQEWSLGGGHPSREEWESRTAPTIFVVPPTGRAEGPQSTKAMRDMEQSLNERQHSVMDREESLRERGLAMRDGEESLRERGLAMRDGEESLKERELTMRDGEESLRERELAMRDREESLRDRELAMRDRERWLREREQSMRPRDTREYPESPRHKDIALADPRRPRVPRRTYSYGDSDEEFGAYDGETIMPQPRSSPRWAKTSRRRNRGDIGDQPMTSRRRSDRSEDDDFDILAPAPRPR